MTLVRGQMFEQGATMQMQVKFPNIFRFLMPLALACIANSALAEPSGLTAEKHGRVVDATTGSGIANAHVIVNWVTDSSGVSGILPAGRWCDLQNVVITDASGNFIIPAVSDPASPSNTEIRRQTPIGELSSTSKRSYRVYVFKQGFVRREDVEKIAKSRSGVLFEWEGAPAEHVSGDQVDLGTLELSPTVLDPESTWVYDASIRRESTCRDRLGKSIQAPAWANLMKEMALSVAPLPCQLPADDLIDPASLKLYRTLVNDAGFRQRMLPLLEGAGRRSNEPVAARTVCSAQAGTQP